MFDWFFNFYQGLVQQDLTPLAWITLVLSILLVGLAFMPKPGYQRKFMRRNSRKFLRPWFLLPAVAVVIIMETGSGPFAFYAMIAAALLMVIGATVGLAGTWYRENWIQWMVWVTTLLASLAIFLFALRKVLAETTPSIAGWMQSVSNMMVFLCFIMLNLTVIVAGGLLVDWAVRNLMHKETKDKPWSSRREPAWQFVPQAEEDVVEPGSIIDPDPDYTSN